jgi:hypothetical protein
MNGYPNVRKVRAKAWSTHGFGKIGSAMPAARLASISTVEQQKRWQNKG